MKRPQKEKTIYGQILYGYLILTVMITILVMFSIVCIRIIESNYSKINSFNSQQLQSQEVITAHYQWLEQLSDSISTDGEFEGSLNPNTCALGKWLNSASTELNQYPEIKNAISEITSPHEEIHSQAASLVELSKTSKDEAYEQYSSQFKPKVQEIGSKLQVISGIYSDMSNQLHLQSKRVEQISNILLILIGVLAVLSSIIVARRMAKRISAPILAITKWSEQLSTGVDNLQFDSKELENKVNAVELSHMIQSFRQMSDSIKRNVDVIKKVASGDLTAYVDIKSDGDSLGQSLYHLVQNNDFMFSNLLQIADNVATNANQISDGSQMLAESSASQAEAVETLSSTVHKANDLAGDNAGHARNVSGLIQEMNHKIEEGQENMSELLGAVDGIKAASSSISIVMKSINDIAFQTNILALNAAVEAARAGQAGKGFAVVADEVRNLALKSQEAAEQSRALIENTISKAEEGGTISEQASETFLAIVNRVKKIEDSIYQIDNASARQQELINEVTKEIERISGAVSQNAASTEETAASTEQMNASAAEIKKAIKKFNLRKRVMGRPYIPPEKKDDPKFIEEATLNYQTALKKEKVQPL